jgi:hypothetical protein
MTEISRRALFGAGVGLMGAHSAVQSTWGRAGQAEAIPNASTAIAPLQPAAVERKDFATFADFGGVGDGSTDNAEAWRNITDWASRRGLSGNTPKMRLPAGRYVSTSIPNLAINRLHIEFEGEVWLINTGTGHSFILDGGSDGAGAYGLKITGWPQIYGPPNSLHGIYARAIHNSEIELNCRGAGSTSSGFYGEWMVDNKIRFIISSNEGGLFSAPIRGMHLTSRNLAEETSYNDIEMKISGLKIGMLLNGALGNNIRSGSIQNCRVGMNAMRLAWDNKFWGTDFESNGLDFRDSSRRLSFHGCDINSEGIFDNGSTGARVFGGRMENLTISSGAENVLLAGMGYNRTGHGRLLDAGTATRYRDVLNIANRSWHDPQT